MITWAWFLLIVILSSYVSWRSEQLSPIYGGVFARAMHILGVVHVVGAVIYALTSLFSGQGFLISALGSTALLLLSLIIFFAFGLIESRAQSCHSIDAGSGDSMRSQG